MATTNNDPWFPVAGYKSTDPNVQGKSGLGGLMGASVTGPSLDTAKQNLGLIGSMVSTPSSPLDTLGTQAKAIITPFNGSLFQSSPATNVNNNTKSAGSMLSDWQNGGATPVQNSVNNATNNAILGNLNSDILKNSPAFNPNQPNTSPLQRANAYQMSSGLNNPYQPKVNDWANAGIQQNQQRIESAQSAYDQNRYDMNNGPANQLLLNAGLARNNNNRMKIANEQLSNDKRYASANLEDNNQLGLNDLNARRNNDLDSARLNLDTTRANNDMSNSQFNRQLQTYNANANNTKDQYDTAYKQGMLQLEQQKNAPALQKAQLTNQLVSNLAKYQDTTENRNNYYQANKPLIDSMVARGDTVGLSQLGDKYNNYLQTLRDAEYNNPQYAVNGIINPKANVQPKAKITINPDGTKTVEWEDVRQGSSLLPPLVDAKGQPVYANSNVAGGTFK